MSALYGLCGPLSQPSRASPLPERPRAVPLPRKFADCGLSYAEQRSVTQNEALVTGGSSMTAEPSQTARSRRLGLELRRLREDNRLTLEMASSRMDRSVSSISRIENGKVSLPVRDLPHFLDVYGVTNPTTCEALTALARDAQKKDWWGKY